MPKTIWERYRLLLTEYWQHRFKGTKMPENKKRESARMWRLLTPAQRAQMEKIDQRYRSLYNAKFSTTI